MPDAASTAAATTTQAPAAPAAKTDPAPKAGAAESGKPASEATEQRYKVKVDGKEEEVPLSELQKHYGTFKASQKAMQESAELRKQAEEAIGHLKKGTREALYSAGLTKEQIRTIAIETLAEEHQALMEEERKKGLTNEQRELEDTKAKLKDAEEEKKKITEEKQAHEVSQAKTKIANAVIETLQQFPESVQHNEALANAVFNAWAYCIENPDKAKELGIEISAKGIHGALMQRQRELARELLAHAKDEELDDWIPPTTKGRLFKTQKAVAEAAAHPSLTGKSETRNGQGKVQGSGRSSGKMIRDLTLGSLGLK